MPIVDDKPKSKYNLLADAHKAMKEPSDHTHKAHTFAVHLMAHHHSFVRGRRHAPTTHADMAPPFMCQEIMELVTFLVDSRTVSEVLKARQRAIALWSVRDFALCDDDYTLNVLNNAFPQIGPKRKPYMRVFPKSRNDNVGWDDVISMSFKCYDKDVPLHNRLTWTVSVDLKQICIARGTKNLVIPPKAVTVTSNVLAVQDELKLSDTLVDELLEFKFNATISNQGHQITFCSDSGIGFVMNMYFKHVWGRTMPSYKGIAVGDTVRIVNTYIDYEFTRGREGVVRLILGVNFTLFVVEIDGVDSAISKQIAEVHNSSKRGTYVGQPNHCVACQISHVQKI